MATFHVRYPADYSDEEILVEIRKYQAALVKDQKESPLEVVAPLITLGLNELQRRTTDKTHAVTRKLEEVINNLTQITKVQADIANRQSEASKKLSGLALAIASLSLVGTILFSVLDFIGDKRWQEQQIHELEIQNNHLERLLIIEGSQNTPAQ